MIQTLPLLYSHSASSSRHHSSFLLRWARLGADGLGLLVGVVAARHLEFLNKGDVSLLGRLLGDTLVDDLLPGVLLGLALYVEVGLLAGLTVGITILFPFLFEYTRMETTEMDEPVSPSSDSEAEGEGKRTWEGDSCDMP